jgi:tripartite-type tricarboxylate transporter receptor subunit TctC
MKNLFLKAAAAALALAASTLALAQADWPSKQITIVVGFSPGGSTDFVARIMADEFRKAWGQAVVVENKPGAGGNIGANLVAKAKPDGYTLLMGSVGPLAINATLYSNMPYDNIRDFQPVSQVVGAPNMLVVNPTSLPAKDFPDFLRLLKASPNKYFFASTGVGTSAHLSGELLKSMTGVEVTHVPYKGAVALNDLLNGEQVHFMFATIPSVIQHVRSGRLKGIAVTTKTRSASSPDLPAIAELGYPDFEASSWFGLLGPAGMPREIAMKIQAEVVRVLKIPEIRDKLIQQGVDPVGSTPDEFAAYIKSETEKWAKVVKMAGAKAN